MQQLSLEQVADYLETADIEQTIDVGHAIVHIGRQDSGHAFVLVNNALGGSTLTESL